MDIDFMAGLSHELKTPLNSLMILAQQLAENPGNNLTDKQLQHVKTIFSCGEDLNDLVNDFLDYTKLKNKVVTAEFHPVNIKDITKYLESIFVPVADSRNIKFSINTAENLPEFVETDYNRLNQILKNLISNALKFTDKGEVVLSICLSEKKLLTDKKNDEPVESLSFSVADTGKGVPVEILHNVFDPFISKKGTGLGLYISKGLAELLGGSLEMKTESGLGSVFTLFIPVMASQKFRNKNQFKLFNETFKAKPIAQFIKPGAVSSKLSRKIELDPEIKILIIDDREENLDSIEAIFEGERYNFYRALSGKEAFKILLEVPDISLILLDVQMPELNGFDTAEQIGMNESFKDIPIIFLTAYSYGDANIFKGYQTGAVDYLFKPINPQILKIKVSVFIELFRKNHLLKRQEQKLIRINSELQSEIKERIKFENELKLSNQEKIKESLHEKELLLKEIYHRVKNNLQVISSLLNLQAGYLHDEEMRDIFLESRNRILSMALVHERLYKYNDLSKIDFGEYLEELTRNLVTSYRNSTYVTYKINRNSEVFLDLDHSIPLGLCVNEMITNSLKHAFKGLNRGHIEISLMVHENLFYISVSDNGIGIQETLNIQNSTSLGMQLINSLVEQLNGKIELISEGKTEFKIFIPLRTKKIKTDINNRVAAI